MKNQYMFFEEQLFEDFDLGEYNMYDISIPNTNVHIYEFECIEAEDGLSEEERARKLDHLSTRLTEKYSDMFRVISSESSQYFCENIYPLVVTFETKLRYALYISRALFENGNVNKDSFGIKIGEKNKKEIEETDFGEIYEALFTDPGLQEKVKKINGQQKLTKADLIKKIDELEETSVWEQIVGSDYSYIGEHFLEIKDYRNDVMHNHLMTYTTYVQERLILQKAVAEIERVISDKLLVNDSDYSNNINIFEVLGGLVRLVSAAVVKLNEFVNSDNGKKIIKGLERLGSMAYTDELLLTDGVSEDEEEDEDIEG